jgi:hypothetical protein
MLRGMQISITYVTFVLCRNLMYNLLYLDGKAGYDF